ncbi:MAG: hypothetical protein E6Q62_02840 [Nitrosomonas sp.]|nr:MAG: hypothetical protein E6Q62_02840 [Nitrosomonas sp.]
MSFSEYDVTRRTWKGSFLKQTDQLIDWNLSSKPSHSLRTGVGCRRPPSLFWVVVVQDAVGRNLERWFKW